MTTRLIEPCKTCNGTGLVPRARRRLPNGEPDQLDILEWLEAICDTCSGSGRVPLDRNTVAETAPA